MDLKTMRRKLRHYVGLLEPRHIAAGRAWYANAHTFCEELARAHGLRLEQVVAVLAITSVNNRWEVNKRNTEDVCAVWASKGSEGLMGVSVATYASQRDKLEPVLSAGPDVDLLPLIAGRYGPKTRCFYDNLVHPGTSYRVTCDVWILRAFGLSAQGGNRYVALYRDLEEAFRLEAQAVNLRPCELQAAVWCLIQEIASVESWEGTRPGSGIVPEDTEDLPF